MLPSPGSLWLERDHSGCGVLLGESCFLCALLAWHHCEVENLENLKALLTTKLKVNCSTAASVGPLVLARY